jgi:segregation and condensation protein A
MIQLPTEFRAALESYQGPLDLLLYLIKREEVDILDIPVGRITEQYCAYLRILQSVDPNACGEFLVMATQLMEIKSRSLLPTESPLPGEEMEDPRVELVRQLLEYKKYKERALLLAQRIEDHSRRFQRPPARLPGLGEEEPSTPLNLGNVSIWDLLTAFHRIQLAIGARGPHRVLFEDRPLEDYISSIRARAEASFNRRILFDDLFASCRDIYDAIGYFLAILEMAKQRLLSLHQEEMFGPIEILLREGDGEPAPAAADALGAAEGPGGAAGPPAEGSHRAETATQESPLALPFPIAEDEPPTA